MQNPVVSAIRSSAQSGHRRAESGRRCAESGRRRNPVVGAHNQVVGAHKLDIVKPPLQHLQRFCRVAYKLIAKDLRVDNKMGAHAKRCRMTSYFRNATGIWRLLDMES